MSDKSAKLRAFIDAANRDDREGDHVAIVARLEDKDFGDGPKVNLVVTLPAASNSEASVILPEDYLTDAELDAVPADKRKVVGHSMELLEQLEKHYMTSQPRRLTIGSTIEVKVVKTKETRHPITGAKKGGWPRIVAFLAPGTVKAAPESDIPY